MRTLLFVSLIAAVGCSGGSGGGMPGRCPPEGTRSNEKGFGASCSPGGGQCDRIDAGIRLCPPDLDPSLPPSTWFCTWACARDADCGSGQVCVHDPQGDGCMPVACVAANCPGGLVDGGCVTDGGR